jgi:hypothetical protein
VSGPSAILEGATIYLISILFLSYIAFSIILVYIKTESDKMISFKGKTYGLSTYHQTNLDDFTDSDDKKCQNAQENPHSVREIN